MCFRFPGLEPGPREVIAKRSRPRLKAGEAKIFMKPPVRLQRPTLLVADLPRALAFWRDTLGFEEVFTKDSDAASYSYTVFGIPRGTPVRFCVLGTPGQRNCLALTEVPGLPPVTATPRRAAVVVECADFDRVVERSRALGLHVFPEETLLTKDGRKGRETGILDFDGNLAAVYLITEDRT